MEKKQTAVESKRFKLDLSLTEFNALIEMADTISALRGCDLDFTEEADYNLKHFDKMLNRNGYRRKRR